MKTVHAGASLATGLAMTDLDLHALWLRYFALTGGYSQVALQSYLKGAASWSAHEHDVAAQALNEYFADHGVDHLIRYSAELECSG